MEFKIDENLPAEAATLFRSAGHEAATVGDQGLAGASDTTVAERIQAERRVLVTADLDFSDIRAYPPADYSGLLVLRLRQLDKPHVLWVLSRLLQVLEKRSPAKELWIVEEERVRIRVGQGE